MKKALLIGINYINTNISLNGCISDIVNMNEVLKNTYNYDDITMLRDDIQIPSLLPTRNNILIALQQLISDSVNCTEIWIHYSGHGSRVRDFNGDEKSGYDSVIVPLNYMSAGYIVDDDLYNIIKKSKCKTIILMDSCNSGSVIDLPWSYTLVSSTSYMRSLNNRYNLSNPQIFMFSGCKDSQTSADVFSVRLGQSVGAFTDSFLTCLKHANYQIPLLMLYRNVCIYLNQNRFSQLPVYSSSSSNPSDMNAVLLLPVQVQTIIKRALNNIISGTGIEITKTKEITTTEEIVKPGISKSIGNPITATKILMTYYE